jgi:hypothetical protein
MPSNRARLRAAAAVLAALAGTLSGAATAYASSTGSVPAAAHRPTTTTYDSLHWAGYTFPVGHVTGVRADWTEPRVTGRKGDAEFVWIGIGGWGRTDYNIIQAGTYVYYPKTGGRGEGIWWERVPTNPVAQGSGVPVHAGDHIRASITLLSRHRWRMSVADTTTGASFAKDVTFRSLEANPSFVVEDPGNPKGPFTPFARWRPVTFTHIGIRVGTRWIGAAQLSRYRVNMVRDHRTLATVGGMTRQSGFTATQR